MGQPASQFDILWFQEEQGSRGGRRSSTYATSPTQCPDSEGAMQWKEHTITVLSIVKMGAIGAYAASLPPRSSAHTP